MGAVRRSGGCARRPRSACRRGGTGSQARPAAVREEEEEEAAAAGGTRWTGRTALPSRSAALANGGQDGGWSADRAGAAAAGPPRSPASH